MDEDKLNPWTRYANAYEAAEKASEEAREIVKCLGIPYRDAMDQIREAKAEYRNAMRAEWQAAAEADRMLCEAYAAKAEKAIAANFAKAEKDLAEYKEKIRREKEEPPKKI